MDTKTFLEMLQKNSDKGMDLIKAKNQDYATNKDPFSNFRMVENIGLATLEQAILMRMCDKFARIVNLLKKDSAAVKDESVEDTLLDIMNYANILLAYRQNKNGNKQSS